MKLSKVYKAKSFGEAEALCPEGYEMLEIWELFELAAKNHPIIFETEKEKWIFFFSKTRYKDDSFCVVIRNGDGYWYAGWSGLDDSDVDGRVFFKEKETKK